MTLNRRTSSNRGFVPGDAPGSVSYFTPKTTLDQMDYECRGINRHPVVANLEKQLSIDPYRHRSRATAGDGETQKADAVSEVEFLSVDADIIKHDVSEL